MRHLIRDLLLLFDRLYANRLFERDLVFFSVVYDLWEVFEEEFAYQGLTKPNNCVESGKGNKQS